MRVNCQPQAQAALPPYSSNVRLGGLQSRSGHVGEVKNYVAPDLARSLPRLLSILSVNS
jgi:enamine deaminase RidA (YjgF/YER057c/UK114 family)